MDVTKATDTIHVTDTQLRQRVTELFTTHPQLAELPANTCGHFCCPPPNINPVAIAELHNLLFLLDEDYSTARDRNTPG